MEERHTGTVPGTVAHTEAVVRLLAGLRVGEQNRGLLSRMRIDGRPAREVCEAILADTSAAGPARRRCLQALRRLDDPATAPLLGRLLADQDRELVQQVCRMLVEDLPVADPIPPLRAQLQARVTHRDLLATALGELGAREALEDLMALWEESPLLRAAVLAALRRLCRRDLGAQPAAYRAHLLAIEPSREIEELVEDLEHPERWVREAALEDLVRRGSPRATGPLVTLAESDRASRHRAGRLVQRLLPHLPELAADARCHRDGRFYPTGALEALVELHRHQQDAAETG